MTGTPFTFAGQRMVADLSGALALPEAGLVVASDLHFEKGSAIAGRGRHMPPPYDSRATLAALARVLRHYRPERVICLGDSFHDEDAVTRLPDGERARLRALTAAHEWTWIAGNHDGAAAGALGGAVADELRLGPLVFRHEARAGPGAPAGEVSGHYHPKAAVRVRGRHISGRCFATDGRRLIVPAFGAFAGGLDVMDAAYDALLTGDFRVFLLGRARVFALTRRQLSVPPPYLS